VTLVADGVFAGAKPVEPQAANPINNPTVMVACTHRQVTDIAVPRWL